MIELVKTITIRDEVYAKLISIKGENESFSELFDRLADCQDTHKILLKLRGSVEFTDKNKMLSELYAKRAERRR
jgi:predicted CopG family antitoxin